MSNTKSAATPRARWVRSTNPHTPGAFLMRGGKQIGRVIYSEFTRTYSCFVGASGDDRWLGCAAGDIKAAKETVEAAVRADAERKGPAVWTFSSTSEAYGACQCRDDIRDGDVLVIEREKVIGIAHTWPFALTENHGDLHTLRGHLDPRTWENGKHAPGVAVAEQEAARMGVPLTRVDTAATEPANETKRDRA